jgi:hypothetical protein
MGALGVNGWSTAPLALTTTRLMLRTLAVLAAVAVAVTVASRMPLQAGDVVDMSCVFCNQRLVVDSVCHDTSSYTVREVRGDGTLGRPTWAPADFQSSWCRTRCTPCLEFKAGDVVDVRSEFPWIPWTTTRAVIVDVHPPADCGRPYRILELGPNGTLKALSVDSWVSWASRRVATTGPTRGWILAKDILGRSKEQGVRPRFTLPRHLNRRIGHTVRSLKAMWARWFGDFSPFLALAWTVLVCTCAYMYVCVMPQ